jgi:hypothetical protein
MAFISGRMMARLSSGAIMTPKLSDDQRQAIEEHGGAPVYVVDAATNANDVLLRAEQYEQFQAIFEREESHPREFYPLIERSFLKAGWDDPAMAAYDHYDEHRPQA